jgi:nitrogen fixation-related uncharacterized protein
MLKWSILSGFGLLGIYFFMWAFQSALYSVSDAQLISELYKTKAIILFPVSLLFISHGVLFFIVLEDRERDKLK